MRGEEIYYLLLFSRFGNAEGKIVRFKWKGAVREVLRLEHEGACHPWDIAGYTTPLMFNFETRNHRVLLSKYYCWVDRPRHLKLRNRLTSIYIDFTTFDFVIEKYQIRMLLYSSAVNL